ncbi:MAG TPA: CoA pyrophosphatase [Arachnia sp.]|nr:CoA pyrophosphatase [Arachnia sp.]HQD20795.1 CoA pyrophosphatase [Arachnia sp.]
MTGPFDQLAAALAAGPTVRTIGLDRTPRGERSAAVLMLLTEAADPEVTFVTRAETLRRHAGQVALPGGAVDPGDESRFATALREAHEEIGLDPVGVSLVGELPPLWVPASRYDVTTVVATWRGDGELWPADPAETGAVHQFPVSALAAPGTRVTAQHPLGFRGPAFVLDDTFIWGLTAHLVDWVLDLAGWARPWDKSRVVDIPERFLRD